MMKEATHSWFRLWASVCPVFFSGFVYFCDPTNESGARRQKTPFWDPVDRTEVVLFWEGFSKLRRKLLTLHSLASCDASRQPTKAIERQNSASASEKMSVPMETQTSKKRSVTPPYVHDKETRRQKSVKDSGAEVVHSICFLRNLSRDNMLSFRSHPSRGFDSAYQNKCDLLEKCLRLTQVSKTYSGYTRAGALHCVVMLKL
jgi:hypothetical protein